MNVLPPARWYSKVQANCWPVTSTIASVAGLAGAFSMSCSDDVGVGAQAEDQSAGIAVQMTSRRRVAVDRRPVQVLLARAHPEVDDREDDDLVTRTKTGTETMIRTS